MIKKKQFSLIVFFYFVFGFAVYAQHEAQYTQYMYNTLSVTPAYAGSRGVGSFFGLQRMQWLGFTGGPMNSILSYHTPVGDKGVGVGAFLSYENIGPMNAVNLSVDASYTITFNENSKLAFGLRGSIGWSDFDRRKINVLYTTDIPFEKESYSYFSPNVGAGIYWYGSNFYVGFSVPSFLRTDAFGLKNETTISVVRNAQHYHILGGYVFDLTPTILFKPAALIKIVAGAPLQFDVSANFLFNEKFTIGAAYRLTASVSVMAGFQINPRWFIGYAFDAETSKLFKYNYGSHEIFLRYELFNTKEIVYSPRFF